MIKNVYQSIELFALFNYLKNRGFDLKNFKFTFKLSQTLVPGLKLGSLVDGPFETLRLFPSKLFSLISS